MSNNINKKPNSLKTEGENVTNNTDTSSTCRDSSTPTPTLTNTTPENINQIIQSGVEMAKNIQFNLSQNNSKTITSTNTSTNNNTSSSDSNSSNKNISENVTEASTLLQNINNIKEQLARLNLDPTQRLYFDNCVNPLLTTLYELTASSATLSSAVSILTTSPIVHPKSSQLKDTIHLIYNMNEQCEDIYKILKKRIDTLLNIY